MNYLWFTPLTHMKFTRFITVLLTWFIFKSFAEYLLVNNTVKSNSSLLGHASLHFGHNTKENAIVENTEHFLDLSL